MPSSEQQISTEVEFIVSQGEHVTGRLIEGDIWEST